MKKLLLSLLLLGTTWAEGCHLKPGSFFKMETGVTGGIYFHRDSMLLVVPNSQGGAEVWLEEAGKVRKGVIQDVSGLAADLSSVYALQAYEPSIGNLDPYGLRSSLHAHDGKRCFAYSPQRDCSVDGQKQATPSQAELTRFRELCARLHKVESAATTPASQEELQAAERVLWKS
jgi:hypothetical protein